MSTASSKKPWSKERLRKWLISQLRRLSYRVPDGQRLEAMRRARVGYGKYKCAHCAKVCAPKEYQLDHIEPVIAPEDGWVSYDVYVERLFLPEKGADLLQALCLECHHKKSAQENARRRAA